MPDVDLDALAFYSPLAIDKIIWESPLESQSIAADTTTSWTMPHSEGGDVIVAGVFSLDGSNFYPFGTEIFASAMGSDFGPQMIRMDAYIDATTVYFRALSLYDTSQTASYYYWIESIG